MRTRRTGTAGAVVALLALTACNGDGSPGASGTPTTTPSSVPTATFATSAPPASSPPTPTWPAGCASPRALPAGATVITATVKGGKVTPPRRTYDVKLNSLVRLLVTADIADEVHLHTYDRQVPTKPGCPVALDFEAGVPGSVDAEIEGTGLHLFQVRAR